MKRVLKKVSMLALIAASALALTFVGCGGDDPKSLAKQAYEVGDEAAKLYKEGKKAKDPEIVKLDEKAKAIKAKVDALSEEDKKIFEEETARLWK